MLEYNIKTPISEERVRKLRAAWALRQLERVKSMEQYI